MNSEAKSISEHLEAERDGWEGILQPSPKECLVMGTVLSIKW